MARKNNLEIAELKARTVLESVSKAQERVRGNKDGIKALQAEYEAKKA